MASIDHSIQAIETWRDGVTTRMLVSAFNGATGLCIFEQWCMPGSGAPIHTHGVEEVLSVLSGDMELWLGGGSDSVGKDQSVIVPPGLRHGFRNAGSTILHVHATLAAPFFEAIRDSSGETTVRWRLA
jgi:mannose-6-phosphate isomerase-like protein (cupin superfamily)